MLPSLGLLYKELLTKSSNKKYKKNIENLVITIKHFESNQIWVLNTP